MYHISHYNNIITTIILKNIIQGNVCIYCNTNSFILIQDRIKRNYTITGHAGKIWLFAVLSVYIYPMHRINFRELCSIDNQLCQDKGDFSFPLYLKCLKCRKR